MFMLSKHQTQKLYGILFVASTQTRQFRLTELRYIYINKI